MYKTLQNVTFVKFVSNFTKIKFPKKCKKVKNDVHCPGPTNSTNGHKEQEKTEEKDLDAR